MLMTMEEGLALTDTDYKGRFSEWLSFRIKHEYGKFVDCQVERKYIDEVREEKSAFVDFIGQQVLLK
ncbi:MAG: hypothetical protein ACUVQY_07670 [Thermoproteota archaeon]